MNIDQIIFEAPVLGSMSAIADHFQVEVSTLRYRLAKARKLQLVKDIIYWSTDGKRYKMRNRKKREA